MPRVMVNSRSVEAPSGSTILEAARSLGIDVPTLCQLDGLRPNTSCMLCVVEVEGRSGLVPSCAAPVADGMLVETDSTAVRAARRTVLELLLSDHVGDCFAPCEHTCPLHLDIPQMLRQVAEGDLRGAVNTVRADVALPSVMGRVCPQLCERTCRRALIDKPADICVIKQFVADSDLESGMAATFVRQPPSGKRVAIVGAGPCGMASAYYLCLHGHQCVVFEKLSHVGGRLRVDFTEETLPARIIDAEAALIGRLGGEFRLNTNVTLADFEAFHEDYDAVLLAAGRLTESVSESFGLPVAAGLISTRSHTHETEIAGVFAAGDAVKPNDLVVRCVAQAKSAAGEIDQFLRKGRVDRPPHTTSVRVGHVTREELTSLIPPVRGAVRVNTALSNAAALSLAGVQQEAARCLQCGCAARDRCGLRTYAEEYGARAARFHGKRRSLERQFSAEGVIFEPGKCILCGLCVQITHDAEEPLGLTFLGRGFDMRIGVPFGAALGDGLTRCAQRCVEACPTGALAYSSSTCAACGGETTGA